MTRESIPDVPAQEIVPAFFERPRIRYSRGFWRVSRCPRTPAGAFNTLHLPLFVLANDFVTKLNAKLAERRLGMDRRAGEDRRKQNAD